MPIVTAQAELPASSPVAPAAAPQLEATTPAIEPPKEEALSPKFVMLARKEKEIRRQAQAIARQREELKAKESEYQTNYIPKESLTANPLKVLLENGYSYDQIAEMLLKQSDPQTQAFTKVEQDLQAIKEAQRLSEERFKTQETQQRDQAIKQIRSEVTSLVDNNESYETIKSLGVHEAVVELIKETFDKKGVLLSADEAATKVENHLIAEGMKMASLNKVKSKLTPPVIPVAEEQIKKQQITQREASQKPIKTLTHAVSAGTSRGITERERVQRAILAFKGQLNS